MAFNNDALITIHKPWFDEAYPVNADYSTGVLTMAATPVATKTITVGTNVYEVIANGGSVADPSYIAVELATTPTVDNFLSTLETVVNANETLLTAVASTPNDTLTLTYDTVGTEGNSVATTETLSNGSFASATLTGGVYATPCRTSNATIVISGVRYIANSPVTKYSTSGWVSVAETAT